MYSPPPEDLFICGSHMTWFLDTVNMGLYHNLINMSFNPVCVADVSFLFDKIAMLSSPLVSSPQRLSLAYN